MADQFVKPKPKTAKGMLEENTDAYDYRQEIALYSLKRAALRIHALKAYKSETDPLKEDELIEESLKEMKNYNLSATEIADSNAVSRCQLSPDEKYFVTTGWSGECQVWTSVDSPRKVTSLAGHKYQVFDADFHPSVATNDVDSPNIATGGSDCILRLWSLDPAETEQGCLELSGHTDRINRVKFHPNGLHVLTASYDKTAIVWDIEKEKQSVVLKGHEASIHTMSIHPDGALVVGHHFTPVHRRPERSRHAVGHSHRHSRTADERPLRTTAQLRLPFRRLPAGHRISGQHDQGVGHQGEVLHRYRACSFEDSQRSEIRERLFALSSQLLI